MKKSFVSSKKLFVAGIIGATYSLTACTTPLTDSKNIGSKNQIEQPSAVPQVDLNRYMGKWYEIARLPMFFQRNCVSDVTATYSLKSTEKVEVNNQCIGKGEKLMQSIGEATKNDESGSKLKVTFLPQSLRWLPIGKADYWILVIDQNYQYALVGTPDKKYLWILSRTPTLSDSIYQRLVATAQLQGYDVKQLQHTIHTKK